MSTINLQGGNTMLTSGSFPPVRAATTGSNINLAAIGLGVIDGVQLVAGDRVLVKDQNDQTTNGIYAASTGTWTRITDAITNTQFFSGMAVTVALGQHIEHALFILSALEGALAMYGQKQYGAWLRHLVQRLEVKDRIRLGHMRKHRDGDHTVEGAGTARKFRSGHGHDQDFHGFDSGKPKPASRRRARDRL